MAAAGLGAIHSHAWGFQAIFAGDRAAEDESDEGLIRFPRIRSPLWRIGNAAKSRAYRVASLCLHASDEAFALAIFKRITALSLKAIALPWLVGVLPCAPTAARSADTWCAKRH